MNKFSSVVSEKSQSLVAAFGFDVQERRRDRNFEASKSLSRFTILLIALFVACWFQLWIR